MLNRAQQGLNTVAKFNSLGCCYVVMGGNTIPQYTCRHSNKRDIYLQQLIRTRYQNIWSRNLGQMGGNFFL